MCLFVQSVPRNSNEINEWHPALARSLQCALAALLLGDLADDVLILSDL